MKITKNILKKTQIYMIFFVILIIYMGTYIILKDTGDRYRQNVGKIRSNTVVTLTTTTKLPKKSELFVTYWYADWCKPCLDMKPHWRHKTVVNQLKKYKGTKSGTTYKPYKIDIDVEKHIPIVKKYKVTSIPCIILMDNSGVEFSRLVGYSNQSRLRRFLMQGPIKAINNN